MTVEQIIAQVMGYVIVIVSIVVGGYNWHMMVLDRRADMERERTRQWLELLKGFANYILEDDGEDLSEE